MQYQSPFNERISSKEMSAIWSNENKFKIWRTLWYKLAEAQHKLGLQITTQQLEELKKAIDIYNPQRIQEIENETKHDVMAHIIGLGELAPSAKGIIHLGATSQYIVDNCDSIRIKESLRIIIKKTKMLLRRINEFSKTYQSTTTLGFTHFQPAQPTTVGKRGAAWGYDIYLVLEQIINKYNNRKFRSIKGATGTQASFLELFNDISKVEQLEQMIADEFGFNETYVITGQVYPRIDDSMLISDIAALGSCCQKVATDIRLLSNQKELYEKFDKHQVGSSAMPYKKNPITCEKVCGLSKILTGFAQTHLMVSSEQWLERSLDDSSARRIVLPETFMTIDGIIDSMVKIFSNLYVNLEQIKINLLENINYLITEKLLMIGSKNGHDRQELHNKIKEITMKYTGNELTKQIQNIPEFKDINLNEECSKSSLIGLSETQVSKFNDLIEKL